MMTEPAKSPPEKSDSEMKGWLLKWTNYIKGYQRRWFVLSNGVLSYYRSQTEMNHTCRGTISLHGALIHTVDSCTFVISNGGTQTFHIKASNEVERQSWVTALELAKVKAIRSMDSEDDDEEEQTTIDVAPMQEMHTVMRDLSDRLENLRTCYDLITKHGVALQRALAELETNDDEALASRTKNVHERATLFRITSNAMINACNDYLRTAENQGPKWSKLLQHEREQRLRLEEIVEQLANQHTQLEKAAHLVQQNQVMSTAIASDDDDNEFFDAQDDCSHIMFADNTDYGSAKDILSDLIVCRTPGCSTQVQERDSQTAICSTCRDDNNVAEISEQSVDTVNVMSPVDLGRAAKNQPVNSNSAKKRRTRVPDKPNYQLNLWSFMKNCIGKELSKIPMPVNFNEPLSMLQRLTEDYEYAHLLDSAAKCKDQCEQMAYVAAFTISSYSTTANRTGKPFNPLLGETYECDRTEDLGWRCIAEQVSHHPPMAAIHCEGRDWVCWQEFTMTSKFRGKYLQVIPLGCAYVQFNSTGNKYKWRKVTTTVNNIIVGKLWVDQHGEMEITGLDAAADIKCHLKYIPYSYFSRDQQRRVKGIVMNRTSEVQWIIRGTWDQSIEIASILPSVPSTDSTVYKTENAKVIWTRQMPAGDSEKYYNFTTLACQLNEMEEGIAPTDSRLRPDQRLMEDGKWDESNREKLRLEEKQRSKRRSRESNADSNVEEGRELAPYQPIWFNRVQEVGTDHYVHIYNGRYWEHKNTQDWSLCPDLF